MFPLSASPPEVFNCEFFFLNPSALSLDMLRISRDMGVPPILQVFLSRLSVQAHPAAPKSLRASFS